MNIINQLIIESTKSVDIVHGKPKLLELTTAVNSLIYKDLVAVQSTNMPLATLLGLRHIDSSGAPIYATAATYGGKIGSRDEIEAFDRTKVYNKDEIFKTESNLVFKVISDTFDPTTPAYSAVDDAIIIFYGALHSNLRPLTDTMTTAEAEVLMDIADNTFKLDRWSIDTRVRKIKTSATIELVENLRSMGYGEEMVYDLLSKSIAEEINQDIIQKLATVSKRHAGKDIDNHFLDLTGSSSDPSHSRMVYRVICDMAAGVLRDTTFKATYAVCSPNVYSLLSASGWLKENPLTDKLSSGTLLNGLTVYVDATTPVDYVVVGTVQSNKEGKGMVGSLFYSPFEDADGVSYYTHLDPLSLQNNLMANARYGLSVNPYTAITDASQIVAGDDWDKLSGTSKYSRVIGVKF